MGALNDYYGFGDAACAKNGTAFLRSPWPTPDLHPHGWSLLRYGALML